MKRLDPRKYYQSERIDPRHAVVINFILNKRIPIRIKQDPQALALRHFDLDFRGML